MKKRKDLTGQKFGKLTAVSYYGLVGKYSYWNCLCECGKEKRIRADSLMSHTRSCGCLTKEVSSNTHRTHGKFGSKEYRCWQQIKDRCSNPNNSSYNDYGAKGITVCKRWLESFNNFYQDMGDAPSKLHTIDRIDYSKDYSPDNCRWATRKEQANNRSSNKILKIGGISKNVSEWAEELGTSRYFVLKNFCPLDNFKL